MTAKIAAFISAFVTALACLGLALVAYLYLENQHEKALESAKNDQIEICDGKIITLEKARHVLQTETDRGNRDNRDLRRKLQQAELPKSAPGPGGYLHAPAGRSDKPDIQRAPEWKSGIIDTVGVGDTASDADLVRAEAIVWRFWYADLKKAFDAAK